MSIPEVRRLARRIDALSRGIRTSGRASQAAYRSVEVTDGPVSHYDDDGVARMQIGATEDGVFTVVENNTEPPPRPTPPDVNALRNAVEVVWDGTYETANTPIDFAYTEIHASPDFGFEKTDATQVGTFTSADGGVFQLALEADVGDWYFALVAVNKSGLESQASAEVPQSSLSADESTEIPPYSPTPNLTPGVGQINILIDPVPDSPGTRYQAHVVATSGTTPVLDDAATLVVDFEGSSAYFDHEPDGDPLAPDTNYLVKIIAYNSLGDAAASPSVATALRVQLFAIQLNATQDANLLPGNAPALRVGPTDASHLRIDGDEILSVDSDDGTTVHQGVLSLNKQGPVAASGFIKSNTRTGITLVADTDKFVTVTFTTPFPPSPSPLPQIQLTANAPGLGHPIMLAISSKSRSGFEMVVRRDISGDVDIDWTAIATQPS